MREKGMQTFVHAIRQIQKKMRVVQNHELVELNKQSQSIRKT